MHLLSDINLSEYQQEIKERLTLLIDPASRNIPVDPIFLHYTDATTTVVRLFSKASVLEYQRQNDTSRKILQELKEDKTGILIALMQAQNLSEAEKKYKAFLLKMKHLTGEEMMAILNELAQIVKLAHFSKSLQPILFEIHGLLHRSIDVYLHEFKVMAESAGFEKTLEGLCLFHSALFAEQTRLTAMHHGKLLHNEVTLTTNEIVCPVTRYKIAISNSLATSSKAENFLAILIALSQLAHLEDDDIKNFLKTQPKNYLEAAENKLVQYLRYPFWFNFTKEQNQFLEKIGAKEALKQLRYRHLWNEHKSSEENILSLLKDYNKEDWHFPSLGLFLTGHWRRHHHEQIRIAIRKMQTGTAAAEVLQELDSYAKKHPQYNPDGSLARRLEFIQRKLSMESSPKGTTSTLSLMQC
ncbi:Uncharacterised protein [Legionella lansingensis]|uniref:RavJ-like C-terminal domain-containing protein n=1 Tax=Legionella lansingensis TaxID=45067 RepID=A0A0W0VUG5_9GAMM|nr:DUF5617 domain-containing protein [Legionella lansingensis]KTD23763.1 hypothetical protein Llan_0544 [Legionella lansingensis]SNV47431.1 Uncharacterised protein [Legionella lansingensis]